MQPGNFSEPVFVELWRQAVNQARQEGNLTALKLLLAVLQKASLLTDPLGRVLQHECKGMLSFNDGRYDLARHHFEQQIQLARLLESKSDLASGYLHLSRVALREYRLAEMEGLLEEADRLAELAELPEIKVKTLNAQAELAVFHHVSLQIIEKANRALQLARYYRLPFEEAYALNMLGISFSYNHEFAAAEQALNQALELRQKCGDVLGRAETLAGLSHLYFQQADFNTAQTYIESSLIILQLLQNRSGMAQALYQLGQILLHSGQAPAALAHATRAVEMRLELGQPHKLAEAFSGLGQVYGGLHQIGLALACHLKVLELYPAGDHAPLWIDLLIAMSDFMLNHPGGEVAEPGEIALRGYQMALDIIEHNDQLVYLAPVLGRMANALRRLGGVEGLSRARQCYRIQLRLLGDMGQQFFSPADAISQRAEALNGIQICSSLLLRLETAPLA